MQQMIFIADCNKYHLLHLIGTLFPHNNDDARSKSLQIFSVTLFVWWISEKDVSQHGLASPRVLNPELSKHEAGALPNFPAMIRNIFVFVCLFVRIHGDHAALSVSELTDTNGPLATVSGACGPHTSVSVSVATLRSRQRVTKEMVGG